MSTSNFVSGVLLGALAGFTAGLLLAPEKGSDTRQKLMDKGNDLAHSLKEKFNGITGKGNDLLETASDKIEEMGIKGKRKAKDILDTTGNKVEEWQDRAGNSFS